MNRFLITSITLAFAAAANAQLSFNGVVYQTAEEFNCNVLFGLRLGTATIGAPSGGAANLHTAGLTVVNLPRDPGGPTSYEARINTRFCFTVGVTPIQLTSTEGGPLSQGKIVVGGGFRDGNTSAFVTSNTYLSWYDDDNNNNLWDPGEDEAFINSMGSESSPLQTGNGFTEYTMDDYGYDWRYVLASGRKYMLTQVQEIGGTNMSQAHHPPTTITHEYSDPYAGISQDFTYTAVPEPATLAALGIGTVAMLRRKRQKD